MNAKKAKKIADNCKFNKNVIRSLQTIKAEAEEGAYEINMCINKNEVETLKKLGYKLKFLKNEKNNIVIYNISWKN